MHGEATTIDSTIDPVLRDGYEIHAAALERGLDVTLLPRQVMMVGSGNPVLGDASFVHGVPQASTVAGVTYVQDKRVRRALLQREGFTVPRGATFSIGRSADDSVTFAERIGYPVTVKPTMGDNTIGVIPQIADSDQMWQAIEYLHTPFESRSDFTRASYAMTELREPGFRDGVPVAPPSYRYLVEKHISGDYVRALIIDGSVRNVMLCPKGPWNSSHEQLLDVTERLNGEIASYLVEAAKVIPGLSVVAIDIVVPNLASTRSRQDMHIVEYSERPWLHVQHSHRPELARKLATEILTFEMNGRPLGTLQETVSANVRIDGAVAPEKFLSAFVDSCDRLEVNRDLNVSDPALGHITGHLMGAPDHIAWLMESALDQGLDGQRAMLAELHQL